MNKKSKNLDGVIPGHGLGVKVIKTKRRPDGDINQAIGTWKRLVKDAGIIESMRDRKEYQKKSVTRRAELNRAKYIQKIFDQNNF